MLTPFDRISALAYGAAADALLVRGRARTRCSASRCVVRVVGEGAEQPAFGHTFVEVGRFAEATLVLEQVGSATLADNVEVLVGDGAQLTLVTVADWAADAVQAQHLRFRLGRDAKVIHVQVTLGGDLVRQYTSVEYTGRGGEAELYGPLLRRRRPAPGAPAAGRPLGAGLPQLRRLPGRAAGRDAHTVWVGDVLIRAEATGTDTYEINRNLLLTDGARADSVPNLEIETGEVAGAGHASATGRFDDEQLFYLMARGIPETEARKLVVRGFFAELINKIPVRVAARAPRRRDRGPAGQGGRVMIRDLRRAEDVAEGHRDQRRRRRHADRRSCTPRTASSTPSYDECSHAAVALSEGEVDGCTLECWLHGSRFDLRTGEPTGLPATEPVPVYPVEIRDGDIYVSLTPSNGVTRP